jgi:hypothetical protein
MKTVTNISRSGHIHMEPNAREVKAQICIDKEAGTAGLGIAPVRYRVLHISYS